MSKVDAKRRCPWCLGSEQYLRYHDEEWGVPVHDDNRLFELLILEGAQAGLAWSTILNKRDNYRRAFARFDPAKVARFGARDVKRLMADAGIVRNRMKIESAIANARAFLEVRREYRSFDAYLWGFVKGRPLQNLRRDQQGPEAPRLPFRRFDHRVRLYAGGRNGQRSPGRLLSPLAGRSSPKTRFFG